MVARKGRRSPLVCLTGASISRGSVSFLYDRLGVIWVNLVDNEQQLTPAGDAKEKEVRRGRRMPH